MYLLLVVDVWTYLRNEQTIVTLERVKERFEKVVHLSVVAYFGVHLTETRVCYFF